MADKCIGLRLEELGADERFSLKLILKQMERENGP